MPPVHEWQKVLYLKQPFPDHFVPDTFLKDLRKNGSFPFHPATAADALLQSTSGTMV